MALSPPEQSQAAKETAEILPRVTRCLNCDSQIAGRYCAVCGQEAENQTAAVKLLVADFLSDVASFDSKIVRTLKPLLLRPGFLTNEYNAGRRVRYLSPLKVYLTLSLVFFLALAWKHPVSSLQKHINILVPSGAHSRSRDTMLTVNARRYDLTRLSATEYEAQQRAAAAAAKDSPFQQILVRQALKARANPASLAQQFIDSLPKMMFCLLPLFALSLKVMYWRSKRLYIEHLIFLLHAHAFVFLVLTALVLFPASRFPLANLFPLFLSAYLVAALKTVYRQSWPKTLLKSVWLACNYLFLLVLCFVGALLAALLLT